MPSHYGKKSPVKHHGMSVDSKKVKAGHYHDPKKGIVVVKKSTPKIKTPTEYAPFKMKRPESPMKGHMHTDNLPDGRSKSAPFQKKFPDLSGDGKITKKDILMGRGVIDTPNKQRGENKEAVTEDIVRQMKSIEKQLKNMMLSDAKRKELNDKLLELSTTLRGQEYTDTGK
tara:strand:+ start:53 stop:565 length:513 start_codon:yes stop_codon:yes gene_type:complete